MRGNNQLFIHINSMERNTQHKISGATSSSNNESRGETS